MYEKHGPITGVRIWRSANAVFGLQFKFGEKWAEERGKKSMAPLLGCCSCVVQEKEIEKQEINLSRNEYISKVKTKTSRHTGRLFRMRIRTTNNTTFDSHHSVSSLQNYSIPWSAENWPHNRNVPKKESLVLAYCSGLDEEGPGVGKLLNLHWVKL